MKIDIEHDDYKLWISRGFLIDFNQRSNKIIPNDFWYFLFSRSSIK